MLRLLVALLPLLAAPFGFPASSPEPHPHDPGHGHVDARAAQRHELVIDASALPGERGWFLVPVRAAWPTLVEVEAKLKLAHDPDDVQGTAVIVGTASGAWAAAQLSSPWREAEVDHKGRRVACCLDALARTPFTGAGHMGGGLGGNAYGLGVDDTLWVGLVAVGWTPGSKLKITLTSLDAPLHAGRAVTGTTVDAVDLVDEARRLGTSVRVGGQRIAGGEADVTRAWSPAGTGFLYLDAMAQGEAGARISVALPSSTLHAREDLHDEYLGAVAFERGGAFRVTLSGLHERGFDGTPWDDRGGHVSARALYADLSVPLTGMYAWHDGIVVEDDDW